MLSFIEWTNKQLIISAHPSKKTMKDNWWSDFDIVVNVSDFIDLSLHNKIISQGVPVHWLPMGESFGMPLENIFGVLSILWEAEKNKHSVFMHCMAGRNRSVTIADCYYFIRKGNHRVDNSEDVFYGRNISNKLLLNIKDNQLPGIYRMELFLEKCKELFENPKIADNACIDWLKKETFGY